MLRRQCIITQRLLDATFDDLRELGEFNCGARMGLIVKRKKVYGGSMNQEPDLIRQRMRTPQT